MKSTQHHFKTYAMYKFVFLVGIVLYAMSANAQTQVYGANQFQTFASGGTTNGASSNASVKLYSLVGQPIAISNASITQTQAGILSAVTTGLLVVDNTAPTLTNTTAPTFADGDELTVTIDDGAGIGVDGGKDSVFYKPLMQDGTPAKAFSRAKLTLKSGNTYAATIASAFHDEMGIEFYFVGRDLKGNVATSSQHYFTYLKTASKPIPISHVGSQLSDYRLFSIPYDLTAPNNGYNSIFNGAIDGDHLTGRLYGFNTGTQKIESTPTTLVRGQGYWILLKQDPTLSLANVVAPTHTRKDLYSVTIPANKWILLGNPYPTTIKWSDIMTLNGLNASSVSKLYTYNGGSSNPWDNPDALAPFEGAYVQNLTGTDLVVKVGFAGQTAVGGRRETLEMPATTDLNSDRWMVALVAKQRDEITVGGFGMHPNATERQDWYDNATPPAPFISNEFQFSHENLDKSLTTDIVGSKDSFTWRFQFLSQDDADTELSWPPIDGGRGVLYLYDEKNLTLTDMKEVQSYTFRPSRSNSFSVFYGNDKETFLPPQIGVGLPYPNPVSARSVLHFPLALPESATPYTVQVQVYTLRGVPMPAQQHILPSGVHQLAYRIDPTISSDLYFYRVTVSGTAAFSNTGKILIQND